MNTERTYGVELELVSKVSKGELADIINEAFRAEGMDMAARTAGYHHNTDGTNRNIWEVQFDASIRAEPSYPHGAEIVSPVLRGREGLRAIEIVCAALQGKVKVNKSCGLHVHHYIADYDQVVRVADRWLDMEAAVLQALPPSRRSNRFCKPVYEPGATRNLAIRYAERDRYSTLNLTSYSLRNTVEFRCHSGSYEAAKIESWILATQGMVEAAIEGRELTGRGIEDVKAFIAAANGSAEDYEAIRGKRAGRSKATLLLNELIEAGTYTKRQVLDEAERRGLNRKTVSARLSEAMDDNRNPLKTKVEMDADGKLRFALPQDMDYAAAAQWLGARHAHFQAAA